MAQALDEREIPTAGAKVHVIEAADFGQALRKLMCCALDAGFSLKKRAEVQPVGAKALGRASTFLRRQIGSRLRLRRVPELEFRYDESIEGQDRIEQLLNNIRAGGSGGAVNPDTAPDDDDQA